MAESVPAVVVRDAVLVPAVGPVLGGLELRIDRDGITQLGGEPVTGWQIPWGACRDVRSSVHAGTVAMALSFGALRYRWEFEAARIDGGADALVGLLREAAGARAMVRGVRGARRRA